MLNGRNEHIVKNKFISVLRFLKKQGQSVNPNNFQQILETFKTLKSELHPSKTDPISNLPKTEIFEENGDIALISAQNEINMNFQEAPSPLLFQVPKIKNESFEDFFQKIMSQDINLREPDNEKEYLTSFNDHRRFSFELENNSQKMNYLQFSDQIPMEFLFNAHFRNPFSYSNTNEY